MKWVCTWCGKKRPTHKMTCINLDGLNCCDACAKEMRKKGLQKF